jgi:hypothetical protein
MPDLEANAATDDDLTFSSRKKGTPAVCENGTEKFVNLPVKLDSAGRGHRTKQETEPMVMNADEMLQKLWMPCESQLITEVTRRAMLDKEKQFAAEEILFMVLNKMREIQIILEGLKIGKGHELEHCFSGVDKRVCDKGGGHSFQLGNNPKVTTTMSHDPQYWKFVLNGYNWSLSIEVNAMCTLERRSLSYRGVMCCQQLIPMFLLLLLPRILRIKRF